MTDTVMDPLTLPLDYAAIERILPHRYPFLLVDRVTELEPDRRIVGIKNVSFNERTLAHTPDGPVLPPTILTEAVAQVGAILILSKPENREKIPFFMGIEKVRYRQPVRPGDVVEIEAVVKRLRSRVGILKGVGRVNGKVVVEGTMTFALGPRGGNHTRRIALTTCGAHDDQDRAHLQCPRCPGSPAGLRLDVPPGVQRRRREDHHADPRLGDFQRIGHRTRVALVRAEGPEGRRRVGCGSEDVEGEHPLATGACSYRRPGRRVSSHSLEACWTQNPAAEIVYSRGGVTPSCEIAKNGMGPKLTFLTPGSAPKIDAMSR